MSPITQCLERRFPGEGRRAIYRAALLRACNAFWESGLSDPKFVTELISDSDQKFWSSVSEALVYQKLCGYAFFQRADIGSGPDFLLAADQRRLWIEVTCPSPSGLPSNWSNVLKNQVISAPHDAILLRWTGAIKQKFEQLMGSTEGNVGHLKQGQVSSDDIYVIAINGCQLRHGPFSQLIGISQFPYAAEALFPIGPYEVRISKDTLDVAASGHQHRLVINKPNGAEIPCYAFLDPKYEMISAVWAVDYNGSAELGNSEPSALIHNPLAANPLPLGFLPADTEYVATAEGDDDFLFRQIKSGSEEDG